MYGIRGSVPEGRKPSLPLFPFLLPGHNRHGERPRIRSGLHNIGQNEPVAQFFPHCSSSRVRAGDPSALRGDLGILPETKNMDFFERQSPVREGEQITVGAVALYLDAGPCLNIDVSPFDIRVGHLQLVWL